MSIYRNRKFRAERVLLDGNEYFNCEFVRCEIVFAAAAPVTISGADFVECKWVFRGAAELTLAFLTALYQVGVTDLVEATITNIRKGLHPNLPGDAEDLDT